MTHIPSTATVRARYHLATISDTAPQFVIDAGRASSYAEFDRWLAAHDAEVLEKAAEVADRFYITDTGEWLREQARALRREA